MVARRRLRHALREARDARGLTQSDVAEEMEWSLSKVIRIESGEVSISPNDLRPLLAFLGIKERARVDQLMADAKTSRSRQQRKPWWHQAPYKDNLTIALRRYIEFESEAVSSRMFQNLMVPGRIQTEDYARAILENWHGELPEAATRARLDARMRRRADFLAPGNSEHIYLLIDEAVLWRTIGGPGVLADQLSELLRLIDAGRLTTRVITFGTDGPLPTFGIFELIYLTEAATDDEAVIYLEGFLAVKLVDDQAEIARHRRKFEQLWTTAADESQTRTIIVDHIQKLRRTTNT
jgi:transcriptional regulator with XRE-family HTH domain